MHFLFKNYMQDPNCAWWFHGKPTNKFLFESIVWSRHLCLIQVISNLEALWSGSGSKYLHALLQWAQMAPFCICVQVRGFIEKPKTDINRSIWWFDGNKIIWSLITKWERFLKLFWRECAICRQSGDNRINLKRLWK